MTNATALLLLPHLQVQNANAISSPLTWGFPAPSAFTGFAHALERRFPRELQAGLDGIGIVCHHFEPQSSRPAGKRTQVFHLTRNPIGKDEKATALVEEGRAHMEVSLVLAVRDYMSGNEGQYFAEDMMTAAQGMRLAGGSILPKREGIRFEAQYWPLGEDVEGQTEVFRKLRRRLVPGFALVQRDDRLQECLAELRERNPSAHALDALLDLSRLNFEPNRPHPEKPGELEWGIRKKAGWLVPILIGYAAISPLYAAGEVKGARNDATPFRFVESLYSIGEWVSPHRLTHPTQLLWHYHADSDAGIYRCVNHYTDQLINSSNLTKRSL